MYLLCVASVTLCTQQIVTAEMVNDKDIALTQPEHSVNRTFVNTDETVSALIAVQSRLTGDSAKVQAWLCNYYFILLAIECALIVPYLSKAYRLAYCEAHMNFSTL